MKANPCMLPVAALLIIGGWIVYQKQSADTLEREITVLKERIRQAHTIGDEQAMGHEAVKRSIKANGTIDWKSTAGKFSRAKGGDAIDNIRTHIHLQQLLLDMSPEDLCTQLDEIEALDLENAIRRQLREMILGVLADKNPKLLIARLGDGIDDSNSGALRKALGKWAETEPSAAAAWLDQQIAAGKFETKSLDGKNDLLLHLKSVLIRP